MNTLAVTKNLITAGVPEKQAEAQVHALTEATEDLATKADLVQLRADIRADMAEMETRMTWRITVALAGSMTALTAIFSILLIVMQIFHAH